MKKVKLQFSNIKVTTPSLDTLSESMKEFLASDDAKKAVGNTFSGVSLTRDVCYEIGTPDYKEFINPTTKENAHYTSIGLIAPNKAIINASIRSLLDTDSVFSDFNGKNAIELVAVMQKLKGLKVSFANDNLRTITPRDATKATFTLHNRDWVALSKDGSKELTEKELQDFIEKGSY